MSDRRGHLRIIFTHGRKRHFIATGFPNIPLNRKLAQEKAFQIQRDIEYGEFDLAHATFSLLQMGKTIRLTRLQSL